MIGSIVWSGNIIWTFIGGYLLYAGVLPFTGGKFPASNWFRAAGGILLFSVWGNKIGLGFILNSFGSLLGNDAYGRLIIFLIGLILIVIGIISSFVNHKK